MLIRWIDRIEASLSWIAGLLTLILLLCLFVEVLTRYVFFVSIPELQFAIPFTFLWLCMIGAGIAVRRHLHFEVDLLQGLLPERMRPAHRIAMAALTLLGGVALIWTAIGFVELGLIKKDPATGIRMIYIYVSLLFGGALISALALEQILRGGPRPPRHELEDGASP